MNLDDLKYFLALARNRTVSSAAKFLGVKHTTVSRRVASLERQLKTRLFDRLSEGYFLTQDGELFFTHAQRIEEQAFEAQRDIKGHDVQLQGQLKVTIPYDFFCNVIAPSLVNFSTSYPDIDLEFICSATLLDLTTLEADLAVRITEIPPENLIGRKLMPLQHGIYASEKYLKRRRDTEQLILWRSELKPPSWAIKYFPNSAVAARTDEAQSMLAMIKNDMGVARIPCYLAEVEPKLRRLQLDIPPSTWGIWILNHPDLRSTARVRVCKDYLIDVIEQNRSLIEGTQSRYEQHA